MTEVSAFLNRLKTAQWILISAGLLTCATAFVIGVSDNPPGMIFLYIGLVCLAGAWVWNWPSPREFWTLLMISLAAFPVGVILHNTFYLLGTLVNGGILAGVIGFLGVFFFLVAVVAVGPTAFAALVGGIITSWQGMSRLTLNNRSIRRFRENHVIREKTLRKLVRLARQSASSANLQPLKFILSHTEEKNGLIFPNLSWAGYLKDWAGPVEGERPAGYIILLGDKEIGNSFQYDAGIASQSITLGAAERGLGACLIGSIKRDAIKEALSIPERYEILLVIALGKPGESVEMEETDTGGEIKYWRDADGVHHVPKRKLDELILDV